ncbi:MAG TPA: hypothetical protein PKW21_07065 [Rhabdaerophilum sp.]|nr:hypothetical protein [Rhabdaerophilum sp.]
MPTTTEFGRPNGAVLARAAVAACGLWLGALLALPLVSDRVRDITIVAIGETEALRAIARADVAIVGGRGRVFSLRGRSPGFVAALYASGGLLVFGVGGAGCGLGAALKHNGRS